MLEILSNAGLHVPDCEFRSGALPYAASERHELEVVSLHVNFRMRNEPSGVKVLRVCPRRWVSLQCVDVDQHLRSRCNLEAQEMVVLLGRFMGEGERARWVQAEELLHYYLQIGHLGDVGFVVVVGLGLFKFIAETLHYRGVLPDQRFQRPRNPWCGIVVESRRGCHVLAQGYRNEVQLRSRKGFS